MIYPQDYLNKILCGNCSDIMKDIPDNSIDLVVTSPPYDNLRKYNGYFFDFESVANQLFRIIIDGGVVVWIVGDATIKGSETGTSFKQALYFKSIGFNLHDTMIYSRWSGPLNHNRYEQEFEYMFVFSKNRPKTFNPIKIDCKWYGIDSDRTGQKYIVHSEINRKLRSGKDRNNIKPKRIKGNIWSMNNSSQSGERLGHPAPFPENLARDHILSWTKDGDVVLDPMCGSGTTCKMAQETNRKFIGIDISNEYCDISRKRVNYAILA